MDCNDLVVAATPALGAGFFHLGLHRSRYRSSGRVVTLQIDRHAHVAIGVLVFNGAEIGGFDIYLATPLVDCLKSPSWVSKYYWWSGID